MAEEAKWYAVHTYSGYENIVTENIEKVVENRGLQDLIPEVKIPVEISIELDKDGKEKEVERKLFPSYILVKMVLNDDTWYIVRNTRGVTGFVGPGSKPVPLTNEEVENLGVDKKEATVKVDFNVNDRVAVTTGSFAGFEGIVEAVDIENQTVQVIVSMFGKETSVSLPIEQVNKTDN